MYHPAVVAAAQTRLEAAFRGVLPDGLQPHPPATCHAMKLALDPIWDPEKQQQTRPFSQEEEHFILVESLLTKIDYAYAAERYCNPPEAPIWMGDLGFKPLGDVQVGDTVSISCGA